MNLLDTPHFAFIRSLDPEHPTRVDGTKRVWQVRCRIPVTIPVADAHLRGMGEGYDEDEDKKKKRVTIDDGEGQKLDPDASGDTGNDNEVDFEDPVLEGVSSSTSVDFYGTEMSKQALDGMAEQMKRGIPYLPRHGNGFGAPMEWSDVIGKTIDAEVVAAKEVRNAFDPAEKQYVLNTRVQLYKDEPLAQAMLARLERGQVIGQSIGGWFTELQIVQDSDGEVQRVIVLGVELDHLAATRAPANADADNVAAMRSTIAARLRPTVVRGATEFADLPLADEGVAWDWNTAAQDAVLDGSNWDRYMAAHAWYDPDAADTKGGYKLPFAAMIDGELRAVWNGVSAAMGALNGARGGVEIPDADREPVYNLLSKYYAKFEKDPPPLATMSSGRRRGTNLADPHDVKGVQARHIVTVEDGEDGTLWVQYLKAESEGEGEESALAAPPVAEPEATDDTTTTTVDTHQKIQSDCAKVTNFDGRTVLSWPNDVPESDVRATVAAMARGALGDEVKRVTRIALSARAEVDTMPATAQATAESVPPTDDARRSASSTVPLAPTSDPAGGPSEERAMPDTGANVTMDALRALLDEKLAPLTERVAKIESGGAVRTHAPAPAQPAAPTIDPAVAAAEARARAAEDKLASVLSSPMRVGRSAGHLGIPAGPAAHGAYSDLIGRAREGGSTALCAVAERSLTTIVDPKGDAGKAKVDLSEVLRHLMVAAETDGLITEPTLRASWQ